MGAAFERDGAGCAQVAEWLMAADCKSAALCATEVRILPCAPFSFEVVRGERCGSKPGRQRKNGYRAGCTGHVGVYGVANHGAGQVSIADLDTARFFCLPHHPRTAAFAVGL